MGDIALRLMWFVAATTLLSYGSYSGVTYVLNTLPSESAKQAVEIIDQLKPGVHNLSGTISIPSDCNQLKVRVVKTSENVYTLIFETWEDPALPCAKKEVARNFGTTAFAPSVGVQFDAQLDGTPIPIIVRPSVALPRPSGPEAHIEQLQSI